MTFALAFRDASLQAFPIGAGVRLSATAAAAEDQRRKARHSGLTNNMVMRTWQYWFASA
jgi:hypothetical protein